MPSSTALPATAVLHDQLEAHQVFGTIFCAPATSRNRAMVRLSSTPV